MQKLYGILIYFLLFLASVAVIGVAIWLSKGWIAFVVLLVALMLVGVFMMRSGIERVLSVKEAVERQIQEDKTVSFDRYLLVRSYLRIFLPMWLAFFLIPLVPGAGAWLLVLPPILIYVLVALKTAEQPWVTVGWRKGSYWLLQLGAVLFMVTFGMLLRMIVY